MAGPRIWRLFRALGKALGVGRALGLPPQATLQSSTLSLFLQPHVSLGFFSLRSQEREGLGPGTSRLGGG